MNRVLSFPQANRCDGASEFVSKRFCFSCLMSAIFMSVIIGYLLGNKYSAHRLPEHHDGNKNGENYGKEFANFLATFNESNEYNLSKEGQFESNYHEAQVLQKHFEDLRYEVHVSKREFPLVFKNSFYRDIVDMRMFNSTTGKFGDFRYRNARNGTINYSVPKDGTDAQSGYSEFMGLPLYVNYGTKDDYRYLLIKNIATTGCIFLIRLGKISIEEKVKNAMEAGGAGVLLFRDSQQYPKDEESSIKEEISPVTLGKIQATYGNRTRGLVEETENSEYSAPVKSVPVQVIEARTAENLLRDISATNKPPLAWKGGFNALYSIGPGFVEKGLHIVMYTNTINVKFASYDVFAIMEGQIEPDRFVVIGSGRTTFNAEKSRFQSTSAVMDVAKLLSQLRNKGWSPRRSVIFCSWGMEEGDQVVQKEWLQDRKLMMQEGAVAYLRIQDIVTGTKHLKIESSPILHELLAELTSSIMNPSGEGLASGKKTLLDIWKHQSPPGMKPAIWTVENDVFAHFGTPTVSISFVPTLDERPDKGKFGDYETSLVQFWALSAFRLANDVALPMNATAYADYFKYSYDVLKERAELMMRKNTDILPIYESFGKIIEMFKNSLRSYSNDVKMGKDRNVNARISNDKLMQLERLLSCGNTGESLENFKYDGHLLSEIDALDMPDVAFGSVQGILEDIEHNAKDADDFRNYVKDLELCYRTLKHFLKIIN